MSRCRLLHNPRCSKSRAALDLLTKKGVDLEVVEYLKETPTADQLDEICRWAGLDPTELVRAGEGRFAELGLSLSDRRSRRQWIEILCANPILIERPIAIGASRAVVGRPPERVLEVLSES